MFIIGSLVISHAFCLYTTDNVVFQKTNEIFINDARWSLTFAHDLKQFKNLVAQIKSDLTGTDEIIGSLTHYYSRSNWTGYGETFQSLHIEVNLLTDLYDSVLKNFDEYQSLSNSKSRGQRSILAIVGQLMSTLFGTVSEDELYNIQKI